MEDSLVKRGRDQSHVGEHSQAWLEGALRKIEEELLAGDIDGHAAIQCIVSVVASTTDVAGAAIAITRDTSMVWEGSAGLAPQIGSILNSTSGLYAECISSGRVAWSQSATTGPQFVPQDDGLRPAIVYPLWSGGRIQGVLGIFSPSCPKFGEQHISSLGSAAELAGLVIEHLKTTTLSEAGTTVEAIVDPAKLDSARAGGGRQQAFLAELLNGQKASSKSPNRSVLVAAVLGLLLLCGTVLGLVERLRHPVRPQQNESISASAQQFSNVTVDVGNPIPSEMGQLMNRQRPTITGGQLRSRIDPRYPDLALRVGLQGDVHAVMYVDQNGTVTEVRISSGNDVLGTALASAIEHWRYTPFYLGTQRIAVGIPVHAVFRLNAPVAD